MDINQKLDELFLLLDKQEDIKRIKQIKNKIGEEEIELIKNYRDNPTVQNKKNLYDNKLINDYLFSENNLNYLIMHMNTKFKRSHNCENHKW